MKEKEDMRDKRYVQKRNKSQTKYLRKGKNSQHVMEVGAMFIDLLKKYEYGTK